MALELGYAIADVTAVFVEDKILIKNFYQLKGYKATELMNEFPNKWTKCSTERLLKSYETPAQSTDSQIAADTKCRTQENVDLVNDLVLSQEDTSQTHRRSVESYARQTFGQDVMILPP